MEKNQLKSKLESHKDYLRIISKEFFKTLLVNIKYQLFYLFRYDYKRIIKYSVIISLIIGPTYWLYKNPRIILLKGKNNTEYVFHQDSTKTHDRFLSDLAIFESGGKYKPSPENPSYYGKYQIGRAALDAIGFSSIGKDEFIEDPDLQELAMKRLMKFNKKLLISYIGKYEGKTIGDIYITQSGILAASHLGGSGNIIKYLETNGREIFKDGNGTPITKYLKQFSGYKLHF